MTASPQDPPVEIGPCTPAEIDQVAQLERLWAAENITPNPYNPDPPTGLTTYRYLLVARSVGRIIGHISADVETDDGSSDYSMGHFSKGSQFVLIEGMYVLKESRGRGIGSRLLRALLERARGDGINQFFLTAVHRDIAPLKRFYAAHGFSPVGDPGPYGVTDMVLRT